ncbi:hypothetical protein J4727_12780 [Providencia rettgeri]|uniref:Uncharacterized protein n=1 Tax=Providencia rettgeri TaxID=587 RepID=A0A939SRG5_PRORE|nr:hypothetical protein [Providencia rettgeri]
MPLLEKSNHANGRDDAIKRASLRATPIAGKKTAKRQDLMPSTVKRYQFQGS